MTGHRVITCFGWGLRPLRPQIRVIWYLSVSSILGRWRRLRTIGLHESTAHTVTARLQPGMFANTPDTVYPIVPPTGRIVVGCEVEFGCVLRGQMREAHGVLFENTDEILDLEWYFSLVVGRAAAVTGDAGPDRNHVRHFFRNRAVACAHSRSCRG